MISFNNSLFHALFSLIFRFSSLVATFPCSDNPLSAEIFCQLRAWCECFTLTHHAPPFLVRGVFLMSPIETFSGVEW